MKKKLTVSMVLLLMAMAFVTPLAHAQTTSAHTQAASVLTEAIDMLAELNTAVDNPLEQLIKDQLAMESSTDLIDALLTTGDNNLITIAMDMAGGVNSDPNIYVTLNMTADEYKKILDTAAAEVSEVYGNTTIYTGGSDTFITYLGDLFLVTNTLENARLAVTTYAKPETSLAAYAPYKAATARNLENGFMNAYMNPDTILQALTAEETTFTEMGFNSSFEGILKALTAESISVSQVSDGFKFGVAVEADKDKLTALGLTMDKYNFTPSLYKLVSGKDLIYYQERSNIKAQIEDVMKYFTVDETATAEMNTFKVDFKTETGIDFDRELLPLLTKNYLVTLHNSGQLLPGITMIFDVSGNVNQAGPMMLKISEYLKKQLQTSETETGKDIFKYDIASAGGTSFYDFTIYLKNLDDSGDLAALSDEATTLHLRMAVTTDGYMVFSTLPDLGEMFRSGSEGVLSDTALKAGFTNPSSTVNEVAYLNLDNTAAYVSSLMDMFAADDAAKTAVADLFAPWHGLFMRSFGDADSVWVEGKINFDLAAMADYAATLENSFGSTLATGYEDYASELPNLGFGNSFCDVSENDWFYPYVNDLSSQMVISGYEDGCFRPNQAVTRAEFVKMAMKALGKAAAINSSYQPFKDVAPIYGDWYSEDVNMAAMLGYTDGYSDGTFRPNANISRAEAVQMLYNMSTQLPAVNVADQPLESLISFNDVSKDDWFFTAVVAATHYNLVKGATPTTFEPNRNITRAEAAKIINLLQTLEQ